MPLTRTSTQALLVKPARHSGWSRPFNAFQIGAWVFLLLISWLYLAVVAPAVRPALQPIVYTVPSFFLVGSITLLVITTTIDPKDRNVRYETGDRSAKLDRSKRKHVIQDNECYFCQVIVGDRSKHCGVCNKCVADFDHHCKWLNTCIGSRNYRFFLALLGFAGLGLLSITGISFYVFVVNFTSRDDLSRSGHGYPVLGTTASGELVLALVFVVFLLGSIASALVLHLLGFHIYLISQGLGTYDYIKLQREKKALAASAPAPPAPKPAAKEPPEGSASTRARGFFSSSHACCYCSSGKKRSRVGPLPTHTAPPAEGPGAAEQKTRRRGKTPGPLTKPGVAPSGEPSSVEQMSTEVPEVMTPGPKQASHVFAWPSLPEPDLSTIAEVRTPVLPPKRLNLDGSTSVVDDPPPPRLSRVGLAADEAGDPSPLREVPVHTTDTATRIDAFRAQAAQRQAEAGPPRGPAPEVEQGQVPGQPQPPPDMLRPRVRVRPQGLPPLPPPRLKPARLANRDQPEWLLETSF